MKLFRKGLIAGMLVFSLVLSGCSALGGEKWVAKVNGQNITQEEFETRLTDVQKGLEGQGAEFSSEQGKQQLDQLKKDFLNYLVMNNVINQETKKLGLDINDAKVAEQESQIKTALGGDEAYTEFLKLQGLTDTDMKNRFALSEKVTQEVKVSGEEVKKFFDENQQYFGSQPEQVKARHILVETEDEAKSIIKELQSGGDFITLAKEKSKDSSAASGGDLGYFGKGQMVPEFEKAAFGQKVGAFSQTPIKSEFGFHIILVEDHKQAVQANYEQAKDHVAQAALANAKEQKFNEYVNDLMNKTKIEYTKGFEPAKS